ncbi:MAG: methyltransferase domain-containing protein [Hyphomicrobiaceae bacterium]
MDRDTILTYDRDAAAYAADWEEAQSPPDDLRDIVRSYFAPGPTIDIGCGSGRNTAWLVANGFDAIGIDASEGIARARRRHPDVRFARDHLPELASLGNANCANVLARRLSCISLTTFRRPWRAARRTAGTERHPLSDMARHQRQRHP